MELGDVGGVNPPDELQADRKHAVNVNIAIKVKKLILVNRFMSSPLSIWPIL